MKTNGARGLIYKSILLILLSLYFLLVFGRPVNDSSGCPHIARQCYPVAADTPLPKLLSFEGVSSNNQVKLNWKFESIQGLDECILERADKSGEFRPVAYFFMTEDIHLPALHFTDTVREIKTYNYRLALSAKNGSKQYTKILTFDVADKDDQKKSLSYPLVMQ